MIDPTTFRRVLGHCPTGVCVVTSREPNGRSLRMSVGSVTAVSLDPPLVAFFPDCASATWQCIREAGHFCGNVLADRQGTISRRFATRDVDKFSGITHRTSGLGSPVLDEVVTWIECTVDAVHEAGDHFIVVGKVAALAAEGIGMPLICHKGAYRHLNSASAAKRDNRFC